MKQHFPRRRSVIRAFALGLALVLLAAILPAVAAEPGANRIESVEGVPAPAGGTHLRVTFREPPSAPVVRAADGPPRLVLEFERPIELAREMGDGFIFGPVLALEAPALQTRNQLVLHLVQPMAHSIRVEGNALVIAILDRPQTRALPGGSEIDRLPGEAATLAKRDNFTIELGGQLAFDWMLSYHGSGGLNRSVDAHELRRLRVDLSGTVLQDWKYYVEADVDGSFTPDPDVALGRFYASYVGFKNWRITAGQFGQPISLEKETSSKYGTFMERGLPNALTPDTALGIGVDGHLTDHLYLDIGAFLNNKDSEANTDKSVTGRFVYTPIRERKKVVHLGLGFSYGKPDGNQARVRERPEAHMAPRVFDTRTITNVDNIVLGGLEGAVVWGPFSVQGEYMESRYDRDAGNNDRRVSGYYGFVSYFVTDDRRRYRDGEFGRVRPKKPVDKGGFGAWEVAVRASALEDDRIEKLEDITVGVNWYLTRFARVMLNYVHSDYEGRNGAGQADIWQLRAQVYF